MLDFYVFILVKKKKILVLHWNNYFLRIFVSNLAFKNQLGYMLLVFKATFNNISVLLVKKTGVPGSQSKLHSYCKSQTNFIN